MLFAPPPAAAPLPTVSHVVVAPSSFKVDAPGTTVSFTMSAAGHALLRVQRLLPGHKKGNRCYQSVKHGKACTVVQHITGTTHLDVVAGANTVPFAGRVSGVKLAAGRYQMQITPYEGSTKGAPGTASFTVVK
jgi:hypothetical protein